MLITSGGSVMAMSVEDGAAEQVMAMGQSELACDQDGRLKTDLDMADCDSCQEANGLSSCASCMQLSFLLYSFFSIFSRFDGI